MNKTLLSEEKTQMDLIHFDQNGDCSISTHTENSLPPDCTDNCIETEAPPQIPPGSHDPIVYLFGEPDVAPRVGEEYQAILPTLVESHSKRPEESETQTHPGHILSGYSTMLTWINTLNTHTSGPDIKTMKTEALGELHSSSTEEEIRSPGGPGYIVVPELANFSWNALEKDSFLLGLYIFEKNFVLVRRLVATKSMGDILSFYYGHFYQSREYRRWSECRKTKGKKGIGQRIFSGARQQELLKRIFVGVSEESRNGILEVSKMFGEDSMSLSDYVFSLVFMVGVETLVDAFSIGKGKLDLTEMPSESSRSNPTRPEIPTGKALSSLTTDEIVKILSGNYRLSKARANDIFWEAIWPRLLARGWHSEQPNNQGLFRYCLVFLIPGIKKFSRRKLVKGEHYFDSLTDILNKVAKEPELINLDFQEEGGFDGKKEQCEISPSEKKLEKEKHCYLQPRTPNRSTDVMKFTVVDTSLSGGKIREVRSFPSEIADVLTGQDIEEDNGEERSSGSSHDVAMSDLSVAVNLNGKKARKYDKKTAPFPAMKKDSNRAKKVPKARKGEKRENEDHAGSLPKRCRTLLTARDQEEKNIPSAEVKQVGLAHVITQSTGNALEGGPSENVENARSPPLLIDLNLPGAPPEPENEELGRGHDPALNGLANNGMDHPDNLNPRRLSTRYRPPTMRAMQAVASGYLVVSQKRKGKAKCTDGVVVGSSRPADGPTAAQVGEGENGRENSGHSNNSGNISMAVESEVPPEANGMRSWECELPLV